MEEWGRAMDELAPDDPLNAFHEIFHRHVAVIMRFGRFPHRNTVLQRTSTPAEEAFLENDALPLRPAAGPPAGRHPRLRRHGEAAHREAPRPRVRDPAAGRRRGGAGTFEFEYAGPDAVFTKTQEQLKRQGYVRIGDSVPDFTAATSMGTINFHEFIGDSWCVLFSHPADFTPVCTTELGATARLERRVERSAASRSSA